MESALLFTELLLLFSIKSVKNNDFNLDLYQRLFTCGFSLHKHQKVPRCRQKRMVSIDSLYGIYLLFADGESGNNQYGLNRKENRILERILPILVLNIKWDMKNYKKKVEKL